MPRISKVLPMLLALIAFSVAAPAVFADTIVVGANGGFGWANEYPIGTATPGIGTYQAGRIYQQLYNRASFAGPVTITQISFASVSCSTCTRGTVTENLTLRLGTAATLLGAPSTTFSSNRGPDLTMVFSGTLVASLSLNNTFDLIFNLTNSFTYNPANGNLLLDVTTIVPATYTGGLLVFSSGLSPNVSRVSNPFAPSTSASVDVGYGLMTQFSTAAVPEPATMLLLGTGLAGFGAAARKKRRAGTGNST